MLECQNNEPDRKTGGSTKRNETTHLGHNASIKKSHNTQQMTRSINVQKRKDAILWSEGENNHQEGFESNMNQTASETPTELKLVEGRTLYARMKSQFTSLSVIVGYKQTNKKTQRKKPKRTFYYTLQTLGKGMKHVRVLSPTLFILSIDRMMRETIAD